jgi:hypothetical protein
MSKVKTMNIFSSFNPSRFDRPFLLEHARCHSNGIYNLMTISNQTVASPVLIVFLFRSGQCLYWRMIQWEVINRQIIVVHLFLMGLTYDWPSTVASCMPIVNDQFKSNCDWLCSSSVTMPVNDDELKKHQLTVLVAIRDICFFISLTMEYVAKRQNT